MVHDEIAISAGWVLDFDWSDTQCELYEETLSFCRAHLNVDLDVRLAERRLDREAWRRAGEYGLLGLPVPEHLGGMGLDALSTARLVEAFGRGCEDGGLVFSACAHLFAAVMPIVEHGSVQLQRRLVPALVSGERVAANAITEAGAGSDVLALKATASREGGEYRINGAKSYVTNGPVADVIVVYAKTAPEHGYLGISAFAVERETPGVVVGEPFDKMGLQTSPISSIYFDDCRVPASALLGAEGEGAAIFRSSMHWERAALFAGYTGSMERQLERVVEHARTRRQHRKPIGRFQAVAHRIADMKLRLEGARMLLYRACWLRDQGKQATLEVSLAKLAISEAAIRSSLDAIQIFGGMGYTGDVGIERMLRDAVPSTIFSGTSEVQRDLIAKELGL